MQAAKDKVTDMKVLIPTADVKREESGITFYVLRFTFHAIGLILMIMAAVASGTLSVQAQPESPSEYQVKAAFLYNFTKFVEWPAEAFKDPNAPIIIGVVGEDPFGSILDQIVSGKTVNGRRLVIKRVSEARGLKTCHVLFISSSERNRLSPIIGSLNGSSVLTIGDMERFAQQGGMINLFIDEGKVRFEINVGVAERARLKISSKLLSLARVVRG
jgi:hypothetical protein